MIESLLLAVTRVMIMLDQEEKTHATGFFFERDGRLFLVTARHVLQDRPSAHHPDSVRIELHVEPGNAVAITQFLIPLYKDSNAVWHEGFDSAGDVDVAAIELERPSLPQSLDLRAFTPEHQVTQFDAI